MKGKGLERLDGRCMVPMNRDLAENIKLCCAESGTNFADVIDYGMSFMLDNYINNRNARYSRMSADEIKEIYPGITDKEAEDIIKFSKENVLGIVKPVNPPEFDDRYYCPDHFFDPYENYSHEEDDDDKDDIVLNEDEYRFSSDNNDEKGTVISMNTNDAVAILPALSELVKTAHDVNVNIQIVVKE